MITLEQLLNACNSRIKYVSINLLVLTDFDENQGISSHEMQLVYQGQRATIPERWLERKVYLFDFVTEPDCLGVLLR